MAAVSGWVDRVTAGRAVAGVVLAAVLALALPAPAPAAVGVLDQWSTSACLWTQPLAACGAGLTVPAPGPSAVTADGKFVYVASTASGAGVAILSRSTTTGVLKPAGCAAHGGAGGCTPVAEVRAVRAMAVTADGKSLYLSVQDGLVALARNATTGAVSPLGCFSATLVACTPVAELTGGGDVAVSADGKSVYATAPAGTVTIFKRNTTTGALTRTGCLGEAGAGPCTPARGLGAAAGVTVTKDNKFVYVAGTGGTVAVLARNTSTLAITQPGGAAGCIGVPGGADGCTDGGTALQEPGAHAITVAGDGKSAYVTNPQANALVALARSTTTGALTPAGCFAETTALGCTATIGLRGAYGVAVSKDAKSVYVAAGDFANAGVSPGALAGFARNTTTGVLTPQGCWATAEADGCASADGVRNPAAVLVSADGKSAYVTAAGDEAVAAFGRATTGTVGVLHQLDRPTTRCFSGNTGGPCTVRPSLMSPAAVAISKDGKGVYVGATGLGGGIYAFSRTTTTGVLKPLDCWGVGEACYPLTFLGTVDSMLTTPDNKTVYVASLGVVFGFTRNTTTSALTPSSCVASSAFGNCTGAPALISPSAMAISADSKTIYAVTNDGLVRLTRNTNTGVLTQAGCYTASGGACTAVPALGTPRGVAVSPDGKSVYVTWQQQMAPYPAPAGIQVFARNTSSGALTPKDCLGSGGGCLPARALANATAIVVSPDSKSVYTVGDGSVAVFARNTTTGALTQPAGTAGCLREDAGEGCAQAHGLDYPWTITVSADKKSVYTSSLYGPGSGYVTHLVRSLATATLGQLTQDPGPQGCLAAAAADGCTVIAQAAGASGLAVSPDSKQAYVTGSFDNSLLVFTRRLK